MNEDCGCCEGLEELTPETTANSPGLDAISYRVGTHATFLETMKARLSAHCLGADGPDCGGRPRPLLALTTRAADDPSVAMLDAWATVADVLTFYQERIANEGYLRTATERRSLLELARLIGYKPHDGVAASVYLAFTLDAGTEVTIPAGTRAQSVPGPGELLQAFETSEPLPARGQWNTLVPRRTRPQDFSRLSVLKDDYHLYLKGTATNLGVNDALLVIVSGTMMFYRVLEVNTDTAADRTYVRVNTWTRAGVAPPTPSAGSSTALSRLREITDSALAQVGTNINPELKTAIATNKLLEALKQALKSKSKGEVLLMLEEEVLPELRRLVLQPAVHRSPNLRTWIAGIIEELEDVVGSLTAEAPDEAADLDELFDEPDIFKLPSAVATQMDIMYGQPKQVPTIELARALSEQLLKPASKQPASSARLGRGVEDSYYGTSDTAARLSTAFRPALKANLYRALENAPVTPPPPVQVYAMRKQVKLFGSTAPQQTRLVTTSQPPPGADAGVGSTNMSTQYTEWTPAADEQKDLLFLDSAYDKILPGSYVVVHRPDKDAPAIFTGKEVSVRARAAYGVSGDTTLIRLNLPWWLPRGEAGTGNNTTKPPDPPTPFDAIRGTVVFAQSEPLELVEEPVTDDICAQESDDAQKIELDGVYDGLEPGRWLVITGERTDIAVRDQPQMSEATRAEMAGVEMSGAEGAGMKIMMTGAEPALAVPAITATELVMLGGVEHNYDPKLFGDSLHTTIVLAEKLAYCYKRDTVTIYGNVAHATHGETREEVLGSGDGAKAMQSFALRQSPLTYVSAATPSGVESTLTVRVNGVRWRETDTLAGLGPKDRSYVTRTDDEAKTTVVFGNGERGARPPTGVENIKAVYRTGLGRPGNVKPGQISLLATKPLNVSKVVNPLAATGGADRESRDALRRNAPLAVMSLDRLVSVRDYEDFARTFAGVGKASAQRLTDGRRVIVHLTVAGADDIPIAPESDLFNNLRAALLKYGDPYLPLEIEVRALRLLVISAGVLIDPDYLWENVEPQVRGALLARFGFDRRELGQDAYLSEVMGAIQSVPGVVYADVDVFDAIDEDLSTTSLEMIGRRHKPRQRIPVRLARPDSYAEGVSILPAQLGLLSPAVPETLLLKELKA
jgi:hypothetical protein